MIDMSMTDALEILSKNELIALDQFYSPPVGQNALSKMPHVANCVPAMPRVVMPRALEDVDAKMKAKCKDLPP